MIPQNDNRLAAILARRLPNNRKEVMKKHLKPAKTRTG